DLAVHSPCDRQCTDVSVSVTVHKFRPKGLEQQWSYVFTRTVVYGQGKGISACPRLCHIHANGFKVSNFRVSNFRKMPIIRPHSQNNSREHLPGERDSSRSRGIGIELCNRKGIELRTGREQLERHGLAFVHDCTLDGSRNKRNG